MVLGDQLIWGKKPKTFILLFNLYLLTWKSLYMLTKRRCCCISSANQMCTLSNHNPRSLIGAFKYKCIPWTCTCRSADMSVCADICSSGRHHAFLQPCSASPPLKVCKQDNQEEAECHLPPCVFVSLHQEPIIPERAVLFNSERVLSKWHTGRTKGKQNTDQSNWLGGGSYQLCVCGLDTVEAWIWICTCVFCLKLRTY